jgi:hypothetical protein
MWACTWQSQERYQLSGLLDLSYLKPMTPTTGISPFQWRLPIEHPMDLSQWP